MSCANVQVPPASRLGIVARTDRAALGACQGHSRAPAEANDHGLALEVEIHIDDKPWPEDQDGRPALSNAIDIKTDPGALVFLQPK